MSLERLFNAHYSQLRSFVTRRFSKSGFDAEDIVQDVFHNILNKDLSHVEDKKSYLYKTASNLALNRIRRKTLEEKHASEQTIDSDFFNETLDLHTPERIYAGKQSVKSIIWALESFPKKYRITFLMSRIDGKSYKEISKELNISESTVEKHIIKTLKFLRDHMEQEK